jgi:glycosyltransferase involved in cell wall biosynthesis
MDRKISILIKTNLIDRDPRLAKGIDALKRGGYAVTLLCWDRDCQASGAQKWGAEDNYSEIRLRLKAPYGIKILPLLPIWWCFEFFWLMVERWDIVHAINFDSIIPAVIAAKLKRRPIIYEIFDVYADMIVLPRLLRRIGVYIDKIFMRPVNAVIIANEAHPKELSGIPNRNVVGVYNSPPDFLKRLDSRGSDTFTLFFAGVLQRSRCANLDKVFEAIRDINGARLIIAGYGDQVKEIEEWVSEAADKVKFIGKVSYTEVLEKTTRADLLFALYKPVVPTIRYAGGNKLFEAMMAGKPILVSKGTVMADIVKKENCGLVVDCGDVDEIRQAIIRLKESPELCRQLGANGRKAYEQKYNWGIMEQRLLTLYRKISRKSRGKE